MNDPATTATVNTPCLDYQEMVPYWEIPEALMGGTRALRAKGRDLLPQNPAETDEAYTDRVKTSTLFNGFRKTVRSLSSQPFKETVKVEKLAVEDLIEFDQNVDARGRSLTGFAQGLLVDMLIYGKCHFVVDYPDTRTARESAVGGTLSLRDERDLNLRPYFVRVKPSALIGWQGQRSGGFDYLQRIRIRETVTEQVGDWGQARVNQVRVVSPNLIQIYRQIQGDSGAKWAIHDEMPLTIGRIPLVTVYANQTGFLTGLPPLEDLGDMNVKHWQSNSDQDSILHFARIYFLAFLGFKEEDVKVVEVGQARGIANYNPDAHVDVVEHSGEAIRAGKEDLEHKEDQMEGMGAEMLIPRPGNELATVRAINKAEQVSDLQAYCRNLEVGLREGYQYAGMYYGRAWDDLEDVICNIYQGFGITEDMAKTLAELREDYKLGAITLRAYLTRRKQLGLYSDDFDVEEEIASLETANPFENTGVPTGAEDEGIGVAAG